MGGRTGRLESFEVVERLESLRIDACDSDDWLRWPVGECGLGGGRSGGSLLVGFCPLMMLKMLR